MDSLLNRYLHGDIGSEGPAKLAEMAIMGLYLSGEMIKDELVNIVEFKQHK